MGDLLSDLTALPMEVQLGGADGWVHEGILKSATYVQCATQGALEAAAQRCPGWPLLICGHSLGGTRVWQGGGARGRAHTAAAITVVALLVPWVSQPGPPPTRRAAGGVAALLSMLLQQSGLPPGMRMQCITIGTGRWGRVGGDLACYERAARLALGRGVDLCCHACLLACLPCSCRHEPAAGGCVQRPRHLCHCGVSE